MLRGQLLLGGGVVRGVHGGGLRGEVPGGGQGPRQERGGAKVLVDLFDQYLHTQSPGCGVWQRPTAGRRGGSSPTSTMASSGQGGGIGNLALSADSVAYITG